MQGTATVPGDLLRRAGALDHQARLLRKLWAEEDSPRAARLAALIRRLQRSRDMHELALATEHLSGFLHDHAAARRAVVEPVHRTGWDFAPAGPN